MHREGCFGPGAKQMLRELEKQVEKLAEKLDISFCGKSIYPGNVPL